MKNAKEMSITSVADPVNSDWDQWCTQPHSEQNTLETLDCCIVRASAHFVPILTTTCYAHYISHALKLILLFVKYLHNGNSSYLDARKLKHPPPPANVLFHLRDSLTNTVQQLAQWETSCFVATLNCSELQSVYLHRTLTCGTGSPIWFIWAGANKTVGLGKAEVGATSIIYPTEVGAYMRGEMTETEQHLLYFGSFHKVGFLFWSAQNFNINDSKLKILKRNASRVS